MNQPLSIQTATSRNFKQTAKEILGQTLATLAPGRTHTLFETPLSQPESLQDKLIMAYLKRRAFRKRQAGFFEKLHIDFWQGDGGAVYANNCDHRFEDLFLEKQKLDFDQLRQLWNKRKPQNIVEFGCNSGQLLQYMTAQLEGVESATGIEINAEQVLQNQQSTDFDARIDFINADGADWLLENGIRNTLFVSNGGVLEYFQRARLQQMLKHISEHLRPALFFAVEPVAPDHDWDATTDSVPFGEELSFSHNYAHLFESNGFRVVHQRPVVFDSWQMVAVVAEATQSPGY